MSEEEGGVVELYRTGPFVPPISLPGISDIVVTDAFRSKLETSGLAGLRFHPLIKKQIVYSEWHTWDREAEEPFEYPEEGEPENYIDGQLHSTAIAKQMGELWELVLNRTARVYRAMPGDDIYLLTDSWHGEDLFRAQEVGYIYATRRGKDWLGEHAGEYVTFQETRTKDTV